MDTCMRKEGLDYEADVGDLFGRPGVSLGLEPPRDLGGGVFPVAHSSAAVAGA